MSMYNWVLASIRVRLEACASLVVTRNSRDKGCRGASFSRPAGGSLKICERSIMALDSPRMGYAKKDILESVSWKLQK